MGRLAWTLVLLSLATLLSSGILVHSSRAAKMRQVAFPHALLANLAGELVVVVIVELLVSVAPLLAGVLGITAGYMTTVLVIRKMYPTTLRRAGLAVLISWVFGHVTAFILAMLVVFTGIADRSITGRSGPPTEVTPGSRLALLSR